MLFFLFPSCNIKNSTSNSGYPIDAHQTDIVEVYPKDNTITSSFELPDFPNDAPEPSESFGSISGTLYSFTTGITLAKTYFYLTPGDGPDKRNMPPLLVGPREEDIQGITDEKGQFFIKNIPPGTYFLIVEAPYSFSPAVISASNFTPLLLEVKANEKYPLGVVYVSWP